MGRKNIAAGIVAGLIFSGVIIGLAKFNEARGSSDALVEIVNFTVALPAVIFTRLNLPQFAQGVFFFIYWALLGGVFGWLLGPKKAFFKIVLLLLVFGLALAHHFANVKMSNELGAALEALGKWLTGGAR